jgi:hypothetical protein
MSFGSKLSLVWDFTAMVFGIDGAFIRLMQAVAMMIMPLGSVQRSGEYSEIQRFFETRGTAVAQSHGREERRRVSLLGGLRWQL